ncbi:MAG: alcohol dehydrogenase catalytic domain-containing protein [Chloroflexota bacterium]
MLLSAPSVLEIVDQPDPVIERPDDVIVRVRAASVCGSDTHGYTGKGGRRVPPLVMGHEASGEVESIGADVTNVAPGDRIFIMPMVWCGTCAACLAGAFDICPNRKVYGADLPGSFAERVRISARTAVPLPPEVSFLQAALIEPLAVVVKGTSRAKVDAGDSVAVVGAGPIGLLSLAVMAQHKPRHLIALEPQAPRRELALAMGATIALDPTQPETLEQLKAMTGGQGVQVGVEAVGSSASVRTAVDAIAPGGQMVWLGNVGRVVEIDEFKVVWNSLTIHASVGVTRAAVVRAIELIASGAVEVERIVSLAVPLEEGVDAFHRTAQDPSVVKTVLLP